MNSQSHREVFPESRLAADSRAAGLWRTSEDGTYCAAGVGGPITGRTANILLIDDPVKGHEDADSPTKRESVWYWYQSVAYSRLTPWSDGSERPPAVVLIMTRWHADDLAGRLLEAQEKGGDTWTILHHPALDRNDRSFWPSRFPDEWFHRMRANTDPRIWTCLYQGDPTPALGQHFQSEWIRYGEPPDRYSMQVYGAVGLCEDDLRRGLHRPRRVRRRPARPAVAARPLEAEGEPGGLGAAAPQHDAGVAAAVLAGRAGADTLGRLGHSSRRRSGSATSSRTGSGCRPSRTSRRGR